MRGQDLLKLLPIITLVVTSCTDKDLEFKQSNYVAQKFTLQKVDELTLNSPNKIENTIGRLRFRFVSNRDHSLFAFYDEIQRQIIITNRRGTIRNVISGKGKGPGEIVKAGGFNFDEQDQLVVFDQGQIKLMVFDHEGNLVNSAKLENTEYSMGARDLYAHEGKVYSDVINEQYLGDLGEAWNSRLLGIYNYDGQLIDTMGRYDPSVREANIYLIFPIIHVDFEDRNLISAQSSGFHIQIFDLDTQERLARFGRKTAHFKVSDEHISPDMPRQKINEKSLDISFPASIHLLQEYIVLHFENLTESFYESKNYNDKTSFISIYDKESKTCYGDLALPYTLGNVIDGKFYLVESDNPDNYTIGIYELKEKN